MPPETTAGFRLSPQQDRLWTQGGADVAAFRAQCAVRIEGPLDAERLRAALVSLVARYEILRTVFPHQAGMKVPFQVILDTESASGSAASDADVSGFHANSALSWKNFSLATLTHRTGTDIANSVDELLRSEFAAPLDLEHGPVVRAVMGSISDRSSVLVLTLPAGCGDAHSLTNLVAQLRHTYFAEPSKLDAQDYILQYADVVEWQYELLESEDSKAGRDFWREHLRGIDLNTSASVSLPLENAAPGTAFTLGTHAVTIDGSVAAKVAALGRICGATVSEIVLAAWQCLLVRATGRSEITLACSADARKHEELQSALGIFARSLPVIVEIAPDAGFAEIVCRASAAFKETRKWEEAFSWSAIAKFAATPETFALPFAYEHISLPGELELGGVQWSVEWVRAVWERFALKLVCLEQDGRLRLEFQFDNNRFSAEDVARWAEHFRVLLTAAVTTPETPIAKLPWLSEAQRQQVLVDWNQTAGDYPALCFHQLFEQQAARTPARTALVSNGVSLTYAELNAEANQLAHHLRSLGVGPDFRVGLCLERSVSLIVGLLAILKAGGAYVPLQSDHPKARLAQQLEGAVALLTEQKLLDSMPAFPGHVLYLDRDAHVWAKQAASNPDVNTSPSNLAYVIFTSGSTGVPKGVGIEHRNLINYTSALGSQLKLESFPEGLRFATVSALNADLGNTCIFPALASGGALHVIPYETATDARRFADYFTQHAIDVLKIVPSHLQALLASGEAAQILPRKYLITGGETLTRPLVEKILALRTGASAGCELINHYGPTETTIGSLTLPLEDYDWQHSRAASIPIGRPLANTQVYVLDAEMNPVPVGVTGELYIAGAGVTRGYLGQPERTAERFLRDPFAAEQSRASDPAARMYRTGDLARWLPEGVIEFLGRADDQVKVRGFRIELGEVEASLLQHPNVQQAVVLARQDEVNGTAGEKRLVAYVVPKTGFPLSVDELRSHLKTLLPDYMVPSAVVVLEKLPLTANGKVDRQKLPALEMAAAAKPFVEPSTATEVALAAIWAEVLRKDKISADDNFFDLGGHSLLATQVISRIRRVLDVDLPLRAIFEAPTVAGVAAKIDRVRGAFGSNQSATSTQGKVRRVPRDQTLPLSFAQQRVWFLDQLDPNNSLYNIPHALRMRGELNVSALEHGLNEIVHRHEALRTTFASEKGQPRQVIAPSLTLRLGRVDLTASPEREREARARQLAYDEGQQPFNLVQGPLIRATLVQMTSDDHIFCFTMHHSVSDAWSTAVLLDELSFLYEAFVAGKPSPLPPLEIQYADYAAWQREWLQREVLEEQLSYWRGKLQGAPPLLALPTDYPRPDVQTTAAALVSIPFPRELAETLKEFNRLEGATLFMTLLTAYNALLSRLAQQEQIVVGTVVANRTSVETEKLIGFFANLLALRTDLSGKPTFRELLARVKETALGAYAHQDMPFDKLVEELQPERKLSHNAIVQVLFAVQNVPKQRRELTGLELSKFEGELTDAKFDLRLVVVETTDGITGHWIYKTALFRAETVQQIARRFATLLGNALQSPDARLSTLEMMTDAEKKDQGAKKQERRYAQVSSLKNMTPKAVVMKSAKEREE